MERVLRLAVDVADRASTEFALLRVDLRGTFLPRQLPLQAELHRLHPGRCTGRPRRDSRSGGRRQSRGTPKRCGLSSAARTPWSCTTTRITGPRRDGCSLARTSPDRASRAANSP